MYRSTVNYGRKGLPIQALSAVDLALWDCLGKLRKEPVYNLIGGKTKQRLPIYATTARPDLAKKLGFHGAKFPLPYGPVDGDEGMRQNIERIKSIRTSVGRDFPLMVDCYMSCTVNYTVELCRRIDREVENGVKWVEESLLPDDYEGYSELKKRIDTTLITCGEHEYGRYGFRALLDKKCADVLQPDVTWVGGLTEAKRIVAMASAYDIPVIPHGSSVYSYHLQYANTNCPIAEYILLAPDANGIVPLFGQLFLDEPLPQNGYIELDNTKHGFGVTLNPDIKLHRPYEHEYFSASQDSPAIDQEAWLGKASRINNNIEQNNLWI
jgi:L-rhamnonate dehydratase